MTSIVDPKPVALILCDNVYSDSSGKRALVGLFTRLISLSKEGPIIQRKLCVMVSVTEVYPGAVFAIDIVNAETDATIIRGESQPAPPGSDPTVVHDLFFEFHNLVFPKPGHYLVRFLANDQTILQRPLHVVRAGGPPAHANQDKKEGP